MNSMKVVDAERCSLKSSGCVRAPSPATLSKSDIVKTEPGFNQKPRRKRAAVGPLGYPVSFSEDSSDSTGDNWHSLQTLSSSTKSSEWSARALADDKSYSLRPRKQSKTHSLTARTKAEAAVDSAEQKMAYAAQLVLAVQRRCGNDSTAPQPSFAAVEPHARPRPSSSGTSSVKLAEANSTNELRPSEQPSAADQKSFLCVGKQLLAASPLSGRTCLAEVLEVEAGGGRCRLLWQDGSDGWIVPQEHDVQWTDGASSPLHAACPGIAEGMTGQSLVGQTLDIYEIHLAEFVPALVTAYDHASDTHTLLSDDLGVQDRCLFSLTFRVLEPSVNVQQAGKPEQPVAVWTPPNCPDWGSCSNLHLESSSFMSHVEQHSLQEPQQQVSAGSQWSEIQDEYPIRAFCEDALLHSAQISGPIPDACLLPETADRIQLQSSASAADLCWQDLPVWSAPAQTALVRSCETLPSGRVELAAYPADSPSQYNSGDTFGDELDLERLWAEDL